MHRHLLLANYGLLLLLAGCSSLAPLLSSPTPDPVLQATSTPQLVPTQSAPVSSEARILRVWLPSQFDPDGDTPSANLLRQRLAEFESEHAGIEIEVRIKAEDGDSGPLNSLDVTSLAAPRVLPDLIALSRPDLESAALKGLLHPIKELTSALDDPNWYAYARELSRVQNVEYGLPFAGDALVMIHRPEVDVSSWDAILTKEEHLSFFANDPQGSVGLSFYISAGGKILDEQGLPALEEEYLFRALTVIELGAQADVFSSSLLNIETNGQTLQAYRDGRTNIAFTWAANYRGAEDGIIQPVLGLNTPHTFATGWTWALAGSDIENQQVAMELAEFLVAEEFLDNWTRETGYLPTRISQDAGVNAILESAQAIPSNDVLAVLGPLMQEALTRVLNGEQAEVVARSVIEKLK